MDNLTDIELLILARTIGNCSNNDLREVVNRDSDTYDYGYGSITMKCIDGGKLYNKLYNMLLERGIDYVTGMQTTTTTTKLKLEGVE